MERVTVSIDSGLRDSAKRQADADGVSLSAFAARALRNETIRRQLAATPLDEVPGWLDDAEHDEADRPGQAGAA